MQIKSVKRKGMLYFVTVLTVLSAYLSGCGKTERNSDMESVSEAQGTGADTNYVQDFETKSEADGKPDAGSGEDRAITFPQTVSKTIENVSFDMDIITGGNLTEDSLVTAKAQMQKVDIDKAMQRFFSDISEYETYDYEEEDEYGKTVHTGTYVSPDEITLSYGPASSRFVYMKRDLMPYVQNTFIPFQDDRYNADLYSTEMELSFMNRETAFGEIEDALTEIGIEVETDYISYALDYEHMQSQEYHEDIDGNIDRNQYKDQWSSADDCYWFFINQTYHGIPLYHVYNNIFSVVAEDNVPMEAVVSAEGIEWLNIEKVFEFSNENKGVSLAGIDAIVQTVADKYNQVLGDFTYEMTKAQLYYFVDLASGKGIYDVKLVWIVTGTEKNGQEQKQVQVIVDAQTAEEIVP